MRLDEQWRNTWTELGVAIGPAVTREFEELVARYSEPHRKYHTVRHLEECFEKLTEVRTLAEHAAEVEVALWFHDAIYDTRSHQNEVRSAELAQAKVLAFGVAEASAERISRLILATRHDVAPTGNDATVLVDVDLSILGATPQRFDEYEQQVWEEYAWVPEPYFNNERKRILESFLKRQSIFNTPVFIERYEQQARENIERAIRRLDA